MVKFGSLVFAVLFGISALGLATAPVQAAPILQVVGGKLAGAKNVDVSGTLYDVSFQDGSCIELYSGCDQSADFLFNTYNTAQVAARALMDQVLTDFGLGSFDSQSGLTAGCLPNSTKVCIIRVPYARNGSDFWAFSAYNHDDELSDKAPFTYGPAAITTVGMANITFAVFSLASGTDVTVPEPSTLFLFGAGLLGLAGAARRRS